MIDIWKTSPRSHQNDLRNVSLGEIDVKIEAEKVMINDETALQTWLELWYLFNRKWNSAGLGRCVKPTFSFGFVWFSQKTAHWTNKETQKTAHWTNKETPLRKIWNNDQNITYEKDAKVFDKSSQRWSKMALKFFELASPKSSKEMIFVDTPDRLWRSAVPTRTPEGHGPNICIDLHRACWHVKCVLGGPRNSRAFLFN